MALSDLAKSLWNEQSSEHVNTERCRDLLVAILRDVQTTGDTSAVTLLPPTLAACRKTFRRCKRHSENVKIWDDLMESVTQISTFLSSSPVTTAPVKRQRKTMADAAPTSATASAKRTATSTLTATALPDTVAHYLTRLQQHDKELYKNPPVLPPPHVVTTAFHHAPLPRRHATTRRLTFDTPFETSDSLTDFRPNVTPDEVLRGGAFGGTYFRPIHSAVTNVRYTARDVLADSVDPTWITGLDRTLYLTSSTYQVRVNKFGVKCGGSLGMWESSGWISDADPYGWFQWYCRFYQGRRSSDDNRQIARWKGVAGAKGRFKSQLCNKIIAAASTSGMDVALEDVTISPVIRQTLFHWGLLITNEVLRQHQSSR